MDQPPEHEPTWLKTIHSEISTISTSIKDIKTQMQDITKQITDITASADFAVNQANLAIAKCGDVEKSVSDLVTENASLKRTVNDLQKKVVNLECHSRRDNLIFGGIKEPEEENKIACENALLDILKDAGIMHVKFERVHRLGVKDRKNRGEPRHVIAKFSSYKDREQVWQSRFDISKSCKTNNIWIMQDFPEEVKSKRQTLMPALKAALRSPHVKKASLQVDKLIIDSKPYTVESMHRLPPFLQPDQTSVIYSDLHNTVVFFTKAAIFSNLHPLPIRIDGREFSCNEQFFQYSKALHFGDQEIAQKILQESNPYQMMSLAKSIKNFKHAVWQEQAERTLMRANEVKYRQHDVARDALLATGQKKLGEASSNKFYGTGIGLLSNDACDSTKWSGKNLMGCILTKIRDSF
jgi:ribA/ribD-fused uncharacterized protein